MTEVVVVDDDALTAEFVGEVVRGLGYNAAAASSIEDAQAMITADTQAVLIDVHLGLETGLDLIAALSKDPARAHVPVVAMTGANDPDVLATLDCLGVVALLSKPFDAGEAAALVRAVIDTGPKNKRPPGGSP